jgi:tetratricopeptide (TPR) repeat protein
MFTEASEHELMTPDSSTPGRRRWLIVVGILLAVGFVAAGYVLFASNRASSLESVCQTARQHEDWPRLEDAGAQWARWEPDKALPWLYAAEGANHQGALVRVADYLTRLPDQDPRTPAGLLELSHLQFGDLNRALDAAETCRRIIQLEPRSAEAHRRLIFFYAMTRQRAKMIAEARRAIEIGADMPETYVYLIGADWIYFANGYDLNSKWLEAYPENELFQVARALSLVGTLAVGKSDDTPEAYTTYYDEMMGRLIEQYPANLEVLDYHLQRAMTRGNPRGVAEFLSQSPPESLEDSRFWRYKGWLHAHRDEFEEAEAAYRRSLEIHPFDWHSHHELADVLRRIGRLDEVERVSDLALRGKQIMRSVLQAPDTQSIPREVTLSMVGYARDCGDTLVAERLAERHREMLGVSRSERPLGPAAEE